MPKGRGNNLVQLAKANAKLVKANAKLVKKSQSVKRPRKSGTNTNTNTNKTNNKQIKLTGNNVTDCYDLDNNCYKCLATCREKYPILSPTNNYSAGDKCDNKCYKNMIVRAGAVKLPKKCSGNKILDTRTGKCFDLKSFEGKYLMKLLLDGKHISPTMGRYKFWKKMESMGLSENKAQVYDIHTNRLINRTGKVIKGASKTKRR